MTSSMPRTKMVSCVRLRRLAWSRRLASALRILETKWVITAEVVKKATMAKASNGSVTRKECTGGAMYANHPTAMNETTAEERKLPCRDSRTITSRYTHKVVPRLNWSRAQTKVTNARTMLPNKH